MVPSGIQRFQELWHRKTMHEPLTPSEINELEELEAEVLAEEAAYLAPATARLRAEVDHKALQVALLEDLLKRGEALVASPSPKSPEWLRERAELIQAFRRLKRGKESEFAV